MLRRCADPTFKDWHLYGGKIPPVTVCERWCLSYEAFAEDMGVKPSSKHTLDRIDSMQGYHPENCRWATAKEQARNSSTNRLIAFDGRVMTLAAWAEQAEMKYMKLFMRLKRGWSMKDAIIP
jgi:hypothetical protein